MSNNIVMFNKRDFLLNILWINFLCENVKESKRNNYKGIVESM